MCVALVGKFKLCSCVRVERLWLELEKFKKDARAIIPFGALSYWWIQFSMQQTETTQLFADCRGMHTCPSTNQQHNRLTGLCARIRHCIAFACFSFHLILFTTHTRIIRQTSARHIGTKVFFLEQPLLSESQRHTLYFSVTIHYPSMPVNISTFCV